MGPKVSIIVPVYKVEDYLEETVSCLRDQTYRNLEIILVDDGSPDRCGAMCDAYAKQDPRVKVVHKVNGGLSSARNAGTKICTGDYIAFLDSDDVVAVDYIEYLLLICREEKADMAICLTRDFQDGTDPVYDIGLDYPHVRLTGMESLVKLFYQDEVRTGVVGKLFSRNLVCNITFPEGIYYEDVCPMYQTHTRAQYAALGRAYKFGYRHRSTSQSKQGFSEKEMACVAEWHRVYEDVLKTRPELSFPAASRAFSAYAHIFFKIPARGYEVDLQTCWELMAKLRGTVMKDPHARKKAKYCAILSLFGKYITHTIGSKLIYEGI